MTGAVLSGGTVTDFGRTPQLSGIDLAERAGRGALEAVGATGSDVDALIVGTFAGAVLGPQNFTASVLATRLGVRDVPAWAVEAACASGSVAIAQAVARVEAGRADAVLVVGVEKMSDADTPAVTAALAAATDVASEGFAAGVTFPGFFALIAAAYFARFGRDRADLAAVSVKNRANGVANAHAQFRSAVSADEVLASRLIAGPLRLLDCSAISDGAAAVIVSTPAWARDRGIAPIEVLACEQACGPTAPERIDDFTTLPSAVTAARRAYRAAGICPTDVSVAEVHDCFSIAEIVAIEDLGLVPRGEGLPATLDGVTAVDGAIPVNPSGGLLSKGHPVGATGVAQVVELCRQLDGVAANQVPGAEVGLAHNVGGTGGLASVTVLGRAA